MRPSAYIAMLPVLAVLPALTACAGNETTYPSLSIRDFERNGAQYAVAQGEADLMPAPLPADKAARLGALRSEIEALHRAFLAAAPDARRAAENAGGAGPGSDRWSAAAVALASLDSQRSQAAVILADLDVLFVDTTLSFEDRIAVQNVRDTALTRIRAQDATLSTLRAMVRY